MERKDDPLSFFFWSLYLLSFDLQLQITPLIYSNFSQKNNNSIKSLHLFEYDTTTESRPGIAPAPELLINIIVQQKLSLEKCR